MVAVVDYDKGLGREVVQEGCPFLVEIGQVELEIWEGDLRLQGLRIGFEHATEFGRRVGRQQRADGLQRAFRVPRERFSNGRQPECYRLVVSTARRALGLGIERPDCLDLVTEELQSIGLRCPGRIDVEKAATAAQLSRRLHDAHRFVSDAGRVAGKLGERLTGPCRNPANGTAELPIGQRPTHQGQRRCNDNRVRTARARWVR